MLLDLKDLQAMQTPVAEHADELTAEYGNVSKASIGAIERQLLQLEAQGSASFFGEAALDVGDFIATDDRGCGIVNVPAADKLMASPRLYAAFLLWLLFELLETLPETGHPLFFDEAHLLFEEAPPALLDKIEQVVRLTQSKGVGVYFVTQNPIDIPEDVAGQLGNRVQRAFTPREQKAIRAAAEAFRRPEPQRRDGDRRSSRPRRSPADTSRRSTANRLMSQAANEAAKAAAQEARCRRRKAAAVAHREDGAVGGAPCRVGRPPGRQSGRPSAGARSARRAVQEPMTRRASSTTNAT